MKREINLSPEQVKGLCDYPSCNISDPKFAMTVTAKGGLFLLQTDYVIDKALCQRHYERLKKLLQREFNP